MQSLLAAIAVVNFSAALFCIFVMAKTHISGILCLMVALNLVLFVSS